MAKNLRLRLSDITENLPVEDHVSTIMSLRAEFDHTINIVDSSDPIDRYTCAVHAFHLVEDPDYLKIAGFGLGLTFAGPEFVEFLMTNDCLSEIRATEIAPGDLVFYYNDGEFKHVGRLIEVGRVLSKWGTGYLYEHSIQEVPESYGHDVRFFCGPDREECYQLFVGHAKSKGWHFDSTET